MWPSSKKAAGVRLPRRLAASVMILAIVLSVGAAAQESDITQTPNAADAGIHKSLEEQIGAGRGDWFTPDSSSS
jgi:hypothetical protein